MILLPIETSSFLLALQQNTSLFSSQTLTMKWILVSHRSLHLVIIHHQLHSFCLHIILCIGQLQLQTQSTLNRLSIDWNGISCFISLSKSYPYSFAYPITFCSQHHSV